MRTGECCVLVRVASLSCMLEFNSYAHMPMFFCSSALLTRRAGSRRELGALQDRIAGFTIGGCCGKLLPQVPLRRSGASLCSLRSERKGGPRPRLRPRPVRPLSSSTTEGLSRSFGRCMSRIRAAPLPDRAGASGPRGESRSSPG